jgi:hypothetical protein
MVSIPAMLREPLALTAELADTTRYFGLLSVGALIVLRPVPMVIVSLPAIPATMVSLADTESPICWKLPS